MSSHRSYNISTVYHLCPLIGHTSPLFITCVLSQVTQRLHCLALVSSHRSYNISTVYHLCPLIGHTTSPLFSTCVLSQVTQRLHCLALVSSHRSYNISTVYHLCPVVGHTSPLFITCWSMQFNSRARSWWQSERCNNDTDIFLHEA